MKNGFTYLCFTLIAIGVIGQPQPAAIIDTGNLYRESPARINDLVHTKIYASFDYNKCYMHGKVWVTLHPHFYPTDSLMLDAKGMDIHKVALANHSFFQDLKYEYDGKTIRVTLNKKYKKEEEYTIYLEYTAKPNELKAKGSAAISDAKGLYFINPDGKEIDKPIQIWTQGETEATSAWCPTIDKPNQRCTGEIYMTVPAKYVTLSNGKLISQKNNSNGTRTDYWKMDLPHAPYLFFMGVGDFAVIKDSWKGKEVSYYLEKQYASVARRIFGNTPEMIGFYSKITGIEFPWVKYAQMTAREYISGAMENTTATLHSDAAQQDARELADGNAWENAIAHELFHQWFGDYVTTESWSNVTLSESFADYSEMLWYEHKYGKDAGDNQNYVQMQTYLSSNSDNKPLVRFHYNNQEDVFDAVSYCKGGRILNMLRNYVGDSAFFKSLNLYLTNNKFKSAEAANLRLAFEEVTGFDLNWFWDQWYYGSGHPLLDINYTYDAASHKEKVVIKQVQDGDKSFIFPVSIDIYTGANKSRYQVWIRNKTDTFYFAVQQKPDLANFDGDKVLLCIKKENKTLLEYIHQFKYAGSYLDRREAIEFAVKNQADHKAVLFLKETLQDKYAVLRNLALTGVDLTVSDAKKELLPVIEDLAKSDPDRLVKAAAIAKLGELNDARYFSIFKSAITDSSYTVSGNALEALSSIDSATALAEAKKLSAFPSKGILDQSICGIMIKSGDESAVDKILKSFEKMNLSQRKFNMMQLIANFLGKTSNTEIVKKGIDEIIRFRDAIPQIFQGQTYPFINGKMLKDLVTKKMAAGLKEQAEYIQSKIPQENGK